MHQIDPKCLPERLPTSPKSSPKSFPNLSKPLQILSWDLFFSMELNLNFKCVVTSSKMTSKNCPRASKSLPNLSQKLPKTLPKPSQNPFKDVIEKNILLGLDFFTFFLDFDIKNHQFFNGCLLRSGIQISLIFGALSPSQSIVVWLVFRRLWASSAKNEILWKYAFSLGKIGIFQVSSIEGISRFKKQLMKRRVENSLKIPEF